VFNCVEKSELNFIFVVEILIGLFFIITNYLGKLEAPN
jgi:hypothetical protein